MTEKSERGNRPCMDRDQHCRELKIFSVLLHYPGKTLLDHLDHMQAAIEELQPGASRDACLLFMDYLKSNSLLDLQQAYTAAFDMNPSTTLNIAYHVWGDDQHRSAFLAWLQNIYCEAGYERMTGDLPDHLPLLLEFLSLNPRPDGIDMIHDCFSKLEDLIGRLEQTVPPYAALLRCLAYSPTQERGKKILGNGSDRRSPIPTRERGHERGHEREPVCFHAQKRGNEVK